MDTTALSSFIILDSFTGTFRLLHAPLTPFCPPPPVRLALFTGCDDCRHVRTRSALDVSGPVFF